MSTLVAKFGGTSVASAERILNAAQKVAEEVRRGHRMAVIVSAMAGQTNSLLALSQSFGVDSDAAERDAIVATGEQVSAGLMALALQSLGLKARSWQGWQARIMCDDLFGRAHIQGIESQELLSAMEAGEIPVITGFQGVSHDGRMVTLGRGGSDTSAVALAAALKAQRCDIYTDVDGVYTADPRIVKTARKINRIGCDVMLEMASQGSKVLHLRSVALAMKEGVDLQVLSSLGSHVGSDESGTILESGESNMEREQITGIAHTMGDAQVSLTSVPDKPGMAAELFGVLADQNVAVDMVVQTASSDGVATDVTFTIACDNVALLSQAFAAHPVFSCCQAGFDKDVAKLSVVGVGLKTNPTVAARIFDALARAEVNIRAISTSEICISVLVDKDKVEQAVHILHNTFELACENSGK